MSLPKDYNSALHSQANFYAAWFPVTAPFRIGDYGLIQGGVFQKIGHLDDLRNHGFHVDIRTEKGNPISLDFLSEGINTIKTVAGASVPELPAADIEAKLTFEFKKKNSFVVKAAEMQVDRMENIREVADNLAEMRRNDNWSHSYRVVSAVYTGQSCLVLLSSESDTKVEFGGSASALKQLDMGKVDANISVSFSSSKILKSIGQTGALGLDLFKLSFFGNDLDLLAEVPLTAEEKKIEQDWGNSLEDDDL